MILDIINNNYFRSHKYSSVFMGFVIITLSIYFLKLFNLIALQEPYDVVFEIAYGILLLTVLLNYFLFTRIGTLELTNDAFITCINETINTISLTSLKTVKISKSNTNHYYLKFDTGFSILVEMKNGQLNQFKKFCINNNIEIITSSFTKSIRQWLDKVKF